MTEGNIAGGHKATINNPKVSEEAKQHSREVLENENFEYQTGDKGDKNPNNVAGGLKATVKNPRVSDEAKQNAQERLNEMESS
ncbi:MAG: hypothetical protein M1824_005622 [Vezdaea acicularis]|nr:MAG: hypothetical protein M1824_005622 [Vezdaea acicularis]